MAIGYMLADDGDGDPKSGQNRRTGSLLQKSNKLSSIFNHK